MKNSKQQKEAKAIIRNWQKKLYLSTWRFKIVFPENSLGQDDEGRKTLAEIHPDSVYLQASIYIYPDFFKTSAKRREHAIVHELCHCHTEELAATVKALQNGTIITRANYRDQVERLTQMISYIATGKNGEINEL